MESTCAILPTRKWKNNKMWQIRADTYSMYLHKLQIQKRKYTSHPRKLNCARNRIKSTKKSETPIETNSEGSRQNKIHTDSRLNFNQTNTKLCSIFLKLRSFLKFCYLNTYISLSSLRISRIPPSSRENTGEEVRRVILGCKLVSEKWQIAI